MAENIAQLGVEVKPSGINETVSQLERLNQTAQNTVTMMQILNNNVQNIGIRMQGAAVATGALHGANQQAEMSFGQLALKIAGYSSLMNLGIDITRRAASGMVDLSKESVMLAASFERSRMAWSVFMKDVEAGNLMFDELYSLAQRTPLSFQGVENAAQMLKGFGLASQEIIPTLERMGDVARGNDETMQRLALAYGQALAQGRVLTRDLYQFVNAGVPIFDALAQTMGKSVQEVQALVTEGVVGFPEIEKALKALTDQGGLFNNMMDKAATTFEGKLSIAKDNWKAMLAEMGTDLKDFIGKALDQWNLFSEKTLSSQNINKIIVSEGRQGNIQAAIAYAKENQYADANLVRGAYSQLGMPIDNFTGTLPSGRVPTWGDVLPYLESKQREMAALAGEERLLLNKANPILKQEEEPVLGMSKDQYKWRTIMKGAGISDAFSYRDYKTTNELGLPIVAKELIPIPEIVQKMVDSKTAELNAVLGTSLADPMRSDALSQFKGIYDKLYASKDFALNDQSMLILARAIEKFADKSYGSSPLETARIESQGIAYANRGSRPLVDFLGNPIQQSVFDAEGWAYETEQNRLAGQYALFGRMTPATDFLGNAIVQSVPDTEAWLAAVEAARQESLGLSYGRPMPQYDFLGNPFAQSSPDNEAWLSSVEEARRQSQGLLFGRIAPSTNFLGNAITQSVFDEESWLQQVEAARLQSQALAYGKPAPTVDFLGNPIVQSTTSDDQLKKIKAYDDAIKNIMATMQSSAMQSAIDGFYSIGEAMVEGTDAATVLVDSLKSFGHTIIEQLPMMLLEAGLKGVIANPANPAAWGLIAASGVVAGVHGYADATAAQEVATTTVPNALGNVYPAASLKQYENGVYNTPQFFAFAKGGVFGEAGYEAIMPLARSSTGQLGVKASVAPVNVVVNNNAGVSVTSSESTNEAGERQILLTIEKMMSGMVSNGKLDKAMAGRYGTRVVGASRM